MKLNVLRKQLGDVKCIMQVIRWIGWQPFDLILNESQTFNSKSVDVVWTRQLSNDARLGGGPTGDAVPEVFALTVAGVYTCTEGTPFHNVLSIQIINLNFKRLL